MLALGACGSPRPDLDPPAAAGGPPDEVTVTCTPDGKTRLSDDAVSALADGVHVAVDNQAGEPVSLIGLGPDADEGESRLVATTPPGPVGIACYPYSRHEEPAPPTIPLKVEDPQGHWHEGELECNSDMQSAINDFMSDADGEKGEPVELTRKHMKGIRPDDELDYSGYPEADNPSVRVVRNGRTAAVVSFQRAGDDGLLLTGYN
ncbi:MAG: hypothetical protein ACRDKZ_00800, partial [Actinomycetota bacterium]